jgi:hypothetical protein
MKVTKRTMAVTNEQFNACDHKVTSDKETPVAR